MYLDRVCSRHGPVYVSLSLVLDGGSVTAEDFPRTFWRGGLDFRGPVHIVGRTVLVNERMAEVNCWGYVRPRV